MLRHAFGTCEFMRLTENKGVDGAVHSVRDRPLSGRYFYTASI